MYIYTYVATYIYLYMYIYIHIYIYVFPKQCLHLSGSYFPSRVIRMYFLIAGSCCLGT